MQQASKVLRMRTSAPKHTWQKRRGPLDRAWKHVPPNDIRWHLKGPDRRQPLQWRVRALPAIHRSSFKAIRKAKGTTRPVPL
jgi:hypothetical protein